MPDPSVHSRIRSIATAVQRGETEGIREQVSALYTEIEGSDLPIVDRLARIQDLGRILVDLEDSATAAVWFRSVLDYWQDHAPVQGRVRVVVAAGDLARALVRSGHEDDARTIADDARDGLRELERSAPEQVKRFATGLAEVYAAIGPLETARDLWLTALRHVPRDAPSDGDGLLIALADVERRMGRASAADVRLTQAERIVDRTRAANHPLRAASLSARARLCEQVGQLDEAIDRLEAAVTLRGTPRTAHARREQAEDLERLAKWCTRQADFAGARRHLDAYGAMAAARHGRESAEMISAIEALAVTAAEAGDREAARAAFETAHSGALNRGDARSAARAALGVAWMAHAATGSDETGRAFLNAAEAVDGPLCEPPGLVRALTEAHLTAGDPGAAFTLLTTALAQVGVAERDVKAWSDALLTSAVDLAGTGVDVAAQAYEWLLRMAPEMPGPQMARQRAVLQRAPALVGLREAVDRAIELRGRAEVALRLADTPLDGASTATMSSRVLDHDLDRVAGVAPSRDMTAHGLAKRLGIGAWLLQTHRFRHLVAGVERDVAFAVAGNTGAVYLTSLGDAVEVDAWIRDFAPLEGEASAEAGRRLAGRLLAPLRSLAGLRPGDRLYLIPTGAWAAVPFSALPSPSGAGGPWVVHHELVTLFDVGSLGTAGAHAVGSPSGPRVVGAPTLEAANGEAPPMHFPHRPGLHAAAERAAAQLGVAAWTGDQANTEAILGAASPRVLVVATHAYRLPEGAEGVAEGLVGAGALVSLASPEPSERGLGWLSSEALSRADFSGTEVIDLSACALPEGDEVPVAVALAQAGRTAGARAIVVALGRVSDTGMVAFGQAFHQALSAGEPPAKAVRTAQIDLSTRLEPRAWGAFRCVGDGAMPEAASGHSPSVMIAPSDLAAAEVVAGRLYQHLGNPEQALQAFDRAIGNDRRLAEAHFQRGQCLERLTQYPDAVRAYREAATLEPADGAARYALSRLLLKGGQTASAIEELSELGRQFPGDGAVWRDLVHLYRQARKWPKAQQAAERWLAVARDDDMAWHHYASILEAVGEPQKALVARERTVKLKPDDASHWSNLGVHHARRGRFEQAEWSLRRATELDPGHAASWRNLAQVRLELNRAADAEPAARSAIDREPEHPAGHFLLGATLRAMDRIAEARPVLQRSADLGHPGAASMLATLDPPDSPDNLA
ncbi:MAG: CHAT domain-containing protein [Myxococcota bacterium]